MHISTRFVLSVFLAFLTVPVLFDSPAAGQDRLNKTLVKSGYCRVGKQVFQANQAECQKQNGVFFSTKDEALGYTPPRLTTMPAAGAAGTVQTTPGVPPQPLPAPVAPVKPLPNTRSTASPDSPRPPMPKPPPPSPGQVVPAPVLLNQQGISTLPGDQIPGVVQWPDLVDLAITNITISPAQPRIAKDIITITTTVKNIGLSTPEKDAFFQMGLSDDPHDRYYRNIVVPFGITLPRLAPNTEHVITKTITLPRSYKNVNNQMIDLLPGNYKIHAIINTTNFTIDEEHDQSNNQFIKIFPVSNPPAPADLVLDNISLTADCRVKIKFHNRAAAIPDVDFNTSHIKAVKDGSLVEFKKLNEADPAGHSKKAAFPWVPVPTYIHYVWPATHTYHPELDIRLTPGQTASITVQLDFNNRISETNNDNNSKTKSLTCPQ